MNNKPTNHLPKEHILSFFFNINLINSPNLINDLDSGLYKIEKVYDDGAVQQNVIYKNNNE